MLNLQFQFARQAFLGDYKRHYFQTEIKNRALPWENSLQLAMPQPVSHEMMARNDSRNSMLMKCHRWIWVFVQGGVPQISSDGDHQRIFWGLKFLIPGRKFGKYFFGWLDFSRDFFFDIQNNLKIGGSACISRPHSSSNKVQPNLLLKTFFFMLNNLMLSGNF